MAAKRYVLMCMNCRTYLRMGQVYWYNEEGVKLDSVTCDGVLDRSENLWKKQDEFFGRVIEKYLVVHRNHELRFIPNDLVYDIEERIGDVYEVSGDEVLAAPFDPNEIDAQEEIVAWKRLLPGLIREQPWRKQPPEE